MDFVKQFFVNIYQSLKDIRFQIGKNPGEEVSLLSIVNLIFYCILIIVLTRWLRSVLKNRILPRLFIDPVLREAIANMVSYSLGALGLVLILQTTGFNIASFAVIAGGLGIGIGFGLQELTRNFVSGLTLVIERNVKAGDFVEFEGLEGYVKEISTRSTIIRTKAGADVVVPNSQIVESRLINWSHESFVARIHIPVGVAYESDPVLVTEILLKSAFMEPNVLSDPPPRVMFMGFGDSALNFELWAWVGRIDSHPEIRSSLNFILEYNLRQHQIVIPFPQQDLWLRNPETVGRALSTKGLRSAESPQRLTTSEQSVSDDYSLSFDGNTQPLPTTPVQSTLRESSSQPLAIRDLLRKVSYFSHFNDLELRQLIEIGYWEPLKKSEILFRENDVGDTFYIILSGAIEVFVEKISRHLATLKAGNFFGELALMLGIPRTATVRALEDTILFSINKKNFEMLLHQHPELYQVIVQEFSQHKEELAQRRKELKDLGLLDESDEDKNIMLWLRSRLQQLFNMSI